jgi:hypothetical protein
MDIPIRRSARTRFRRVGEADRVPWWPLWCLRLAGVAGRWLTVTSVQGSGASVLLRAGVNRAARHEGALPLVIDNGDAW